MFELLAAFLAEATTPEQRTVILTAARRLVNMGVQGHVFLIDQILTSEDNFTTSSMVDQIATIVKETVIAVVSEQGLTIADTTSLRMATDILNGLEGLTNYDDRQSILQLIEEGDDDVTSIASVLPLTGEFKEDDYREVIESVDQSLLTALSEQVDNGVDYDAMPAREVVVAARTRFAKYRSAFPNSMAEQFVKNGGLLGAPVEDIIDQVSEGLHDLVGADFGQALAGIYLISDEAPDTLIEKLTVTVGQFTDDIQLAMRANTAGRDALTQALAP